MARPVPTAVPIVGSPQGPTTLITTAIPVAGAGGAGAVGGHQYVIVADPLQISDSSMQRPSLWHDPPSAPVAEYAEPGDILFDAMVSEAYGLQRQGGGVCHPVLAASMKERGRDVMYVGEIFRRSYLLRNVASYRLTQLAYRIDIITPASTRTVLRERTGVMMEGGKSLEFPVEYRVADRGRHEVQIHASFIDIVHENKVAKDALSFTAETAIVAISRSVSLVPPLLMPDRPGPSPQLPRVSVSLTLESHCEPLVLIDVRFIPKSANNFMLSRASATSFAEQQQQQLEERRDAHFGKNDRKQFNFVLECASPAALAGGELGCVEWSWRRANGDGGADRSVPITISRIPPPNEVALFVADLLSSSPPVVGVPMVLNATVRNTGKQRRDVALAVHVGKLLPKFLYGGPTTRPLGFAEADGGEIAFTLTLIPLVAGSASLLGGEIELRDARNNELLLWPLRPQLPPPSLAGQVRGDPSESQRGRSGSVGVATLAPQWPVVVAEFFIRSFSEEG